MNQDFEYDVFLSFSGEDRSEALELASRLGKDGPRVWLDEWEAAPGRVIPRETARGLEQSRVLILVMSKNAFARDPGDLERRTILFRDPAESRRRFIPLRLDNAPIQPPFSQFAYVDWRTRSEERCEELLAACRRPAPGTGPPGAPFHGRPRESMALKGHADRVNGAAITPDGTKIISCSSDNVLKLWDMETGECLATLAGHTRAVISVAAAPDGRTVVSASADNTINVWDVPSGERRRTLEGHTDIVSVAAISPDGRVIVSGSMDGTLKAWDRTTGACSWTIPVRGPIFPRAQIAFSPDSKHVIAGDGREASTFSVRDLETGERLLSFRGHSDYIRGVCTTPDGKRVVSSSADGGQRVWELEPGRCIAVLEGHTGPVHGVVASPDAEIMASASGDHTVKVWNLRTCRCMETLRGHTGPVFSVAITPDGKKAVSASSDGEVRIWTLTKTGRAAAPFPAKRYTNAKIVLVGDSGVGKSGLAMRLTENRFAPTLSTDAHRAAQLKLPLYSASDEIDREIWLWDFAGRSDYRLIHPRFMDETVLVVHVFNPRNENPFESIRRWDRDIERAAHGNYHKLLVAGRCDRGGLMVSRKSIEMYAMERYYTHFLETSALTGEGCNNLRGVILENIDWSAIPWTSSPRIFKRLKDEIFALRDEGVAMLRMAALKQRLQMRLPDEPFTLEDLRAVVNLLAGPGIVRALTFGDVVLLQPERINAYAGAVIRSVRSITGGDGAIAEEDVLAGRLIYRNVRRLPPREEAIMLRAVRQIFIKRGLCRRENTGTGPRLVFPSYFRREAPDPTRPPPLATCRFSGDLDEIYATLVLRLCYTQAFENDRLLRSTAVFKSVEGWPLSFEMKRRREGSAEINVHVDPRVPLDASVTFLKYVHEHLLEKADEVVRIRRHVCPHCGTPVENQATIQKRLARGDEDILCVDCEKRVPLLDTIEEKFASEEFLHYVKSLVRRARAAKNDKNKELVLMDHAFAIAGETGQIFRPYAESDHGIDGEIEFKNRSGRPSGKRILLQFKTGESYLHKRRLDNAEIFQIKRQRWAARWRERSGPVMMVYRTSDHVIRWMDIRAYMKEKSGEGKRRVRQFAFDGRPFTAIHLQRMRDRLLEAKPNKGVESG